MSSTAAEDRRAIFEIALVVGVALGAVLGALIAATSLPWLPVVIGGAVLYAVAVLVIALVAG